jgi:D-serine deaminase-like pyridoxal phosphate-dependent protein
MTLAVSAPHLPAPGTPIEEVDTPALLLDLDRFERNATRLMEVMRANGVGWRPHSKAHKSPDIAKRQIEIGAHGVTCAKVSEAEVMVEGGIESVLIANELPLPGKWQRLAALQDRAEVMAAADAPEHVAMASEAGTAAGVEIPLVIEVDIGMSRGGIAPGEPSVELAHRIVAAPGVRFAGIMGYEGHALTVWPLDAKETEVRSAVGSLVDTARRIEAAGIPVPIVSTGGSGTFMSCSRRPCPG